MSKLYQIHMTQQDAMRACQNYLNHRRHKANQRRAEIIQGLMLPTKKFFGLVTNAPAADSVRHAIRIMKSEYDEFYGVTLWRAANFTGLLHENRARQLLAELKTGKIVGNVALTDEMSFLTNWVSK